MLREFLATDVKSIESIGAVCAVFEEIFLGLRVLLHGLVLSEAVAPAFDTGRLDGQYQVIIVLSVEERHEPLLAGESLVDEEVLLIMAHRVTEIDVIDLPSMALKLVNDDIAKVLVVHGIV